MPTTLLLANPDFKTKQHSVIQYEDSGTERGVVFVHALPPDFAIYGGQIIPPPPDY